MRRRDDLVIGPREKAIEAIEAGKKEEAIRYIGELVEEFRPLHDRYAEWIQTLLVFIVEKLGEEAVEEALVKTFHDVYRGKLLPLKNMSHEEIVKSRSKSHRSHFSKFHIEEDDEKTIIVIDYCGSGGHIQREGKLSRGGTKGSFPWSFDQAGVCYYCCHEAVFSRFFPELGLDFMKYEYHKQFDDQGRPTGQPCRWIIYKRKKT